MVSVHTHRQRQEFWKCVLKQAKTILGTGYTQFIRMERHKIERWRAARLSVNEMAREPCFTDWE
ncbi:MAG: deoxycytidylate deaminase [Maritalea sp.]|jgi:deoxycytidylate deaminase